MTDDFSKPYREVVWFGLWAHETADDYGKREALTVLAGAVDCCTEDDMRENREVIAALTWLVGQGHDKRARAFRKALDVPHPVERRQAAAATLHALQNAVGLAWGKVPARL